MPSGGCPSADVSRVGRGRHGYPELIGPEFAPPPRPFRVSIELPERYRPERFIAAGGMAAVWAACDTVLGREVAIKVLAPHLAEDERARRRFQREARTAAALSTHPHAITIYDVGEHEHRPFIVMELAPRGSLADRLRSRPMIERGEALDWLEQAASALDAAHDRGIVHRDVKPGNMLFDERGRLVLADFGIARLAFDQTMTATGELLGSAAYLSPEQADGQRAGPASDRYSLAVVAYELLTGTRPFGAEHFAATARQHVEASPPPPSSHDPSLPAAVDQVMARALAKDPDDRYPTSEAFVSSLRGALVRRPRRPPASVLGHRARTPAGPPTAAHEALAPALAGDRSGRGRRLWVAAVAVLVLAAGALYLSLAGDRGGGPAPSAGPAPSGRQAPGGGSDRASTDQRATERAARARARRRREERRAAAAEQGASGSSSAPATGSAATGSSTGTSPSPPSSSTGTSPSPPSSSTGTSSSPPSSAVTGGASGAAAGPSALNAEGFALMNRGRYGEAVPILQRAVETCGQQVDDLACAYATFNLGRSLRLSGRPGEAIPVLERRLQNPDQREVVQAELDTARAAAGRR